MCIPTRSVSVSLALIALLLVVAPVRAQRHNEKPAQKPAVEKKAEPAKEDRDRDKPADGDRGPTGMTYRSIGPYRGGRALTGVGVPGDAKTYYFGATGGGVWKSTNGGDSWTPVFDKEGSNAIGSIAVAPSDPNIVYVGTGEACIRGNAAQGDGVYRSTDGGKSWKNVGLKDTRAIGKVIVDPRDPNTVFVAALGHPFGPNTERGIFRTTDGGNSWQKVLYKDENTGGIDVVFDPHNSHVLFAALWQVRRTPWTLSSGGPGSGLYRSTEGGGTWKELTGEGLPDKPWGRVGVAVAANSDRVWALIEAKNGGIYRSDDGGGKWALINDDHRYTQRAWYYMHIFADPRDSDTVYVMNVEFHRSTDGGHTFNKVSLPHGDNHGVWIDPADTRRMIATNDGGATITLDGGKTWTRQDNQPTAQFYHVIADNRFPYWVYGAQQDNSTVGTATASEYGAIGASDWYPVGGGESGYIAPDPRDPNIVYAGEYQGQITRYDHRTGQLKEISVIPELQDAVGAANVEHRFQWTAPLMISPHDPNVVYHAGERVFKTTDAGMHWEAISPDLTRNDKSKQMPSGGPITIDDTGTEFYDTIFALAESPLQKGVIWAGSDDGLLHVTRDGGGTWRNITPKDLPEWSRVSQIDPSPFDAGTAYVAIERHQNDDLKPYMYKTSDYGASWTTLVNGIPEGAFVRAVREDPAKKGLLYAGTEAGVFVSYDDGRNWTSLQLNLPNVPVHDLIVKGNDLVLATHGRSFWILDDLSPVRQHSDAIANEAAHLYTPAVALRTQYHRARKPTNAGENPPAGAVIYVELPQVPKEAAIEILDAKGQRVRRASTAETQDIDEPLDPDDEKPKKTLEVKRGLNRFVWDLRYDGVPRLPDYYLYEYQSGTSGPFALPGNYQVKLTVDGQSYTAPLQIKIDPRLQVSSADLEKQFNLVRDAQAELAKLYDAVRQMQDVRASLQDVRKRLMGDGSHANVVAAGDQLDAKIRSVQDVFIESRIKSNEDSLRYPPGLDAKLAYLAAQVGGGNDSAPTEANYQVFAKLKKATDEQLARWSELKTNDVSSFQKMLDQQNVKPLMLLRDSTTAPESK